MGLSALLARVAVRRASVLLVEAPGWALTRYAAERLLVERGWRPALSPADADVLLVCGGPGPRLAAAVDLVWAQLPGPRARSSAAAPGDVDAALDRAEAELLDDDRQRAQASIRPTGPVRGDLAGAPGHHDEDDDDDDARDHGDMEMAPHGIPLAGGDQDRDGLEMDVLHLPLGPILPCWPAGLLLHCTLHGDVVMDLRPEVLDAGDERPAPQPPSPAATALDRAARVLALAGRDGWAATARRLRDAEPTAGTRQDLHRLLHRVRRSRVLRWSLGDTGRIDAALCREHGLDERLAGTVHDRLVRTLEGARAGLGGAAVLTPAVPLDLLPALLTGAELGAVRLVVAGLDLGTSIREVAAA
jgi:hypothetical protein